MKKQLNFMKKQLNLMKSILLNFMKKQLSFFWWRINDASTITKPIIFVKIEIFHWKWLRLYWFWSAKLQNRRQNDRNNHQTYPKQGKIDGATRSSSIEKTESVIYHETPTSNSKWKMKQPSVSTKKSRRNAVEKKSWNDVWRMVQSMERDESKVYHCGSLIAHIINWQTKQISNVISKAY